VEVRTADLNDVDSLAKLRAEWQGHPSNPAYVSAFREWFASQAGSRWWWIAVENDAVIGMVNLEVFNRMPSPDRGPSRWGYLANLFVSADHRGIGTGSALVSALIECARHEGLVRIVLHPSDLSIPMYRRMGFRPADDLLLLLLLPLE
jgi:GNAT superfamily N-acetyltransferase